MFPVAATELPGKATGNAADAAAPAPAFLKLPKILVTFLINFELPKILQHQHRLCWFCEFTDAVASSIICQKYQF